MIILLFLPYESYEITSSATPEEIMAGLSADTETRPPLFPLFYNGGKSFKGKIDREHFVISRIDRGRNYFLPKIEGTVTQHDTGRRISIVISNKSIIYGLIIGDYYFGRHSENFRKGCRRRKAFRCWPFVICYS